MDEKLILIISVALALTVCALIYCKMCMIYRDVMTKINKDYTDGVHVIKFQYESLGGIVDNNTTMCDMRNFIRSKYPTPQRPKTTSKLINNG